MIDRGARPRLAAKARLKLDRHSGQHMLLYPERGMVLNAAASAIVELCDGTCTVGEIVERLHAASAGASRDTVESDVHAFLDALRARGLLRSDE